MAAVQPPSTESAGATRRTETLTATLRAAAARASEAMAGAAALVFAHTPDAGAPSGRPALRAGAGFASPEAAREAADALQPALQAAGESLEALLLDPEPRLGEQAAGGILALPLGAEGRIRGALLVALPSPPPQPLQDGLRSLADSVGLRLDHAFLAERVDNISSTLQETQIAEEEQSDEILKLSEALFAQDIELLRSNEKLGSVDKLKNDFIEKMSRELRTPLNSIIEAIITVLAGENESLSEGAKESLRNALGEGTAFLRTLQNILDLWRIKQGELSIECQEVNFREVVEEAIFSVQDTLGDKPVRIEKALVEPLPKIRTDLAKVNQVLFLLLDNAAKFTREGHIEIQVEVAEGQLRCSIEDTGVGICADDRQYIFDEFFQVDDTDTSEYRGSGLGLTLVRDLLTLLDGEISVASEIGRGTQVVFSVPVQVI